MRVFTSFFSLNGTTNKGYFLDLFYFYNLYK